MAKIAEHVLRENEQEIKEDIELITEQIETAQNCSPEDLKRLQNIKKQLEKNLAVIRKQIDPIITVVDEDSYTSIHNRLIETTIEFYFRYHIWIHEDMKEALLKFRRFGADALKEYSDAVGKWTRIFSSKKYQGYGQYRFEQEWKEQKHWVNVHNPENPFALKTCLEHNGKVDPYRFRSMLELLKTYSLEELIQKYELFHQASKQAEMERIQRARQNSGLG